MRRICLWGLALAVLPCAGASADDTKPPPRQTEVAIRGDAFWVNGRPTYPGRTWHGHKVEGLLFNGAFRMPGSKEGK